MLGCGGSSGSNPPPNPATLVSIQLSAINTNLIVSQTEQLTATGTYSDRTTKDVTGSVTWSTSPAGLATVSTGGMLTAQLYGDLNQLGIGSPRLMATAVVVAWGDPLGTAGAKAIH